MSEPEYQQRASELARLWQGQVMPVEGEAETTAQRARVVPSIAAAIQQAPARRRKVQRLRKLVAALSVAAAALCVLGIGQYVSHRHAAAVAAHGAASGVRALSGTVTLVNGAGPATVSEAAIEVGDALSTAADGRAELKLSDLVLAEIGGSSELALVTPTASAHRVRLDRGRLHAKVNDRASAAPKLVVETPNVDVVVTGTVFQVDVTPGRTAREFVTSVSVTKGRVVVRHGAQVLAAVAAGETWSSASTTAVRDTETETRAAAPVARSAPRKAVTAPKGSLARPGTLAEENELFQNAVDARNGGDDHAEADRLASLLNRYPRSQLAAEARVERMRALQRTGQASQAAREARRYLAEYPEGYACDEARRIVMQDGASSRSAP